MELPVFKYHPDPLDSGSIKPSDITCECCGEARGYVYTGHVFAEDEYVDCICPWCIADGSAHKNLDAMFQGADGIPGASFPRSPRVSTNVVAEVSERTPGFTGWQGEQWFTCCDDAAAFLGRAGKRELEERWTGAASAVQESTGLSGKAWESFRDALDRDGSPTAYVFQCLHCGRYGAYQDCD